MASQWIKEFARSAKATVHRYPAVKEQTKEATNSDPWGPTDTQKRELAAAAYDDENRALIFRALFKRLSDTSGHTNHVFKALDVLEYFLLMDVPEALRQLRNNGDLLFALKMYNCAKHAEPERQQAGNMRIRHKVQRVLDLMGDDELLQEEREKVFRIATRCEGSSEANKTPTIGSRSLSPAPHGAPDIAPPPPPPPPPPAAAAAAPRVVASLPRAAPAAPAAPTSAGGGGVAAGAAAMRATTSSDLLGDSCSSAPPPRAAPDPFPSFSAAAAATSPSPRRTDQLLPPQAPPSAPLLPAQGPPPAAFDPFECGPTQQQRAEDERRSTQAGVDFFAGSTAPPRTRGPPAPQGVGGSTSRGSSAAPGAGGPDGGGAAAAATSALEARMMAQLDLYATGRPRSQPGSGPPIGGLHR